MIPLVPSRTQDLTMTRPGDMPWPCLVVTRSGVGPAHPDDRDNVTVPVSRAGSYQDVPARHAEQAREASGAGPNPRAGIRYEEAHDAG